MSDTYSIKIIFARRGVPSQTLLRGLSNEQATALASHDEGSSSTCTHPENIERTKQYGPWQLAKYKEQR